MKIVIKEGAHISNTKTLRKFQAIFKNLKSAQRYFEGVDSPHTRLLLSDVYIHLHKSINEMEKVIRIYKNI